MGTGHYRRNGEKGPFVRSLKLQENRRPYELQSTRVHLFIGRVEFARAASGTGSGVTLALG